MSERPLTPGEMSHLSAYLPDDLTNGQLNAIIQAASKVADDAFRAGLTHQAMYMDLKRRLANREEPTE